VLDSIRVYTVIRTIGMGQSIAVTYTVELVTRGESGRRFLCTPAEWRVKARNRVPGYGRPTVANLENYISTFEGSTQAGGCNAHLGAQKVVSAKIVDQRTKGVVASYALPTPASAVANDVSV
jgi:hypothetical protein